MKNEIGLWSPNDRFLPSVDKDTKSAIFYVSEPGQIDGLNEVFKAGDWLIYINKDGEENWFKSDSISVFNTSSSANAPDPGVYTKVRLDNNANIVDASYLEASDIPSHQHKFSDIQSQELKDEIINVVSEMFVNKESSSVRITFDENTNTFSAEAVLDEVTLDKNEFGEIEFIGEAGGSAPSVPKTIQIKDVKNLSEKIAELEESIKNNSRVYRTGLEDKNGEVSVKVDGLTIYINEDGELAAKGGGDLDADDLACGEHTHTSSSIEDFEDAVKEIIIEYDKDIHVSDIPIDNETIVINSNGELSAVAMKTQPHTHEMKDIKDLDPKKADVWASEQFLRGQSRDGQHDFTNISIGDAVDILNKDSKTLDNRLDEIEDRINKTVAPEPNLIDKSEITLSGPDELQVYDVIDDKQVTAYTGVDARVSSFYAKKSLVKCYINDEEMVTMHVDQDIKDGTISNGVGQLRVLEVKDSYQGVSLYEGFYKSISLAYRFYNMTEGIYKIKFTQELEDGTVLESSTETFNIYEKHVGDFIKDTSIEEGEYKYVSGVKYRTSPVKAVISPIVINAFKSRFINKDLLFFEDTQVSIKKIDLEEKNIYFNDVEVTIDKVDTDITKNFIVKWLGGESTYPLVFLSYLYDDTEDYIESYRTTILNDNEIDRDDSWDPYYTDETLFTIYDYDVTKPVAQVEPYIVNNITSRASKDFTKFDGPDYTRNFITDSDGYKWMQFRFPIERFRNISIELTGPSKDSLEVDKFGCLKDFKLFLGLASSSNLISKWIDGNKPYNGNSSLDDFDIFPGLDLFKSKNNKRQITIGNKPYSGKLSHLFIRIGMKKDIDCKAFVDSVRNSIYG